MRVTLGNITDTVQQMCMDILWSDPTASDEVLGMQKNSVRDPQQQNNIMCYGPDIVDKFPVSYTHLTLPTTPYV